MSARKRRGWELSYAAGLAITLVNMLTGCSAGQSATSVPRAGQGGLRPGVSGVVPTATQSLQCSAHAAPQGWTWYQDTRVFFRIAVPAHWRTGAFEYIPDGSGVDTSPSHTHVVDLFGPESGGQATSSGKMRSDLSSPVMTIEIGFEAQELADELRAGRLPVQPQPAPICIGAVAVTEYLFTNAEGDVERDAVLDTGPHNSPWTFEVASSASTATRDADLFLTALSTFSRSPSP